MNFMEEALILVGIFSYFTSQKSFSLIVIGYEKQADEAYHAGEVPVGCVFVHQGIVIGKGRNKTNETLNVLSIFHFIQVNLKETHPSL